MFVAILNSVPINHALKIIQGTDHKISLLLKLNVQLTEIIS